jgi:hypothetical protein
MRQVLAVIGGVLLALMFIGFIASAAGRNEQPSYQAPSDSTYREVFRKSVYKGCTGEAATQTGYCNCFADYVVDNYTVDELKSLDPESAEYSDMISDGAAACVDKVE